MGNDGRQKTLMLPLLLSRGHGRSESSLAEEPTIKGLSLKTNLLSQDGAQVPLWVIKRHRKAAQPRLLYPRKQTSEAS